MDLTKVPDVHFEPLTIGETTYRVPTLDAEPTSLSQKLRAYRPQGGYPKAGKVAVEEDEPLSTVCGVENPFAGIFEDEDILNSEAADATPSDGAWTVEHPFSHHFHKAAFGKRLSKLNSLQQQYNCKLEIHGLDAVRISSRSKDNISRLIGYLDDKAASAKLKYTHFVCIPLNSAEVTSSLESLSAQVQDDRLRSAMVSPKKIHFTLAMLRLVTEKDLERVQAILQSFSNAWNSKILSVDLSGIQLMPGSTPQAVRVAYTGGVGGDGPHGWREKLKRLAESLIERLALEGFLDRKKVKSFFDGKNGTLHATVLNSKYAARSCPGELSSSESDDDHGSARQEWNPHAPQPVKGPKGVNASHFLQNFSNFYFGRTDLKELRLCSLVEQPDRPRDPDGFYQTLFVVKL